MDSFYRVWIPSASIRNQADQAAHMIRVPVAQDDVGHTGEVYVQDVDVAKHRIWIVPSIEEQALVVDFDQR